MLLHVMYRNVNIVHIVVVPFTRRAPLKGDLKWLGTTTVEAHIR